MPRHSWEDAEASFAYLQGPKATQPPNEKCKKCWHECECYIWDEYPDGRFSSGRPPTYECPSHGFFELVNGEQVFDNADCYITGPDGKPMRLFER
jgi:hypothetical protein